MGMVTGNWSDFVKGVSARIDEIIDETRDLTPSFKESGLFREKQSDGLIYRTNGTVGLSYLEQFGENASIKEDRTYPGYKTEYVMKQYGKIVSISQMLMNTRPSELEEKLDEIRQIIIATNRTLNKHAWQVLVDSFATTDSSSNFPISRLNDGVAMVSAAHPSKVPGVANRSNLVSGSPVYSEANQFTAIKQLREQLNGRGLPIGYEGKFVVVVPPALEKTAMEVNKSMLRSGTANNDVNYYEGVVDVVSSVYLGAANGGSDTRWWVMAKDDMLTPLTYVKLLEPKVEKEIDFDTKSIRVSIDGSWAFGYSNWEMMVGSNN